jgi:SAM-dependent methyltransferase
MLSKRIRFRLLSALGKDATSYDGVVLPHDNLRFCGADFKDDAYFLASARADADRLVRLCGLTPESRVVDIGCGPGRLPIGILDRIGGVEDYLGIDVDRTSVEWCEKYIAAKHPAFRFHHLDIQNSRYNPDGARIDEGLRFPVQDDGADIVYLYSVFSHMVERDVRIYLKEIRRVLAPDGVVFFTSFVEEDVPDMSVNPAQYRQEWEGPLHCVRYDKSFLESLLEECGFRMDRFEYETETHGMSAVYARPKDAAGV